jgi:hypothetical protein
MAVLSVVERPCGVIEWAFRGYWNGLLSEAVSSGNIIGLQIYMAAIAGAGCEISLHFTISLKRCTLTTFESIRRRHKVDSVRSDSTMLSVRRSAGYLIVS